MRLKRLLLWPFSEKRATLVFTKKNILRSGERFFSSFLQNLSIFIWEFSLFRSFE